MKIFNLINGEPPKCDHEIFLIGSAGCEQCDNYINSDISDVFASIACKKYDYDDSIGIIETEKYRLNIKWPLEKKHMALYDLLKKYDGTSVKRMVKISQTITEISFPTETGSTTYVCFNEWIEEIKEKPKPEKEFREFFKSTGWIPETKPYAYEVWKASRECEIEKQKEMSEAGLQGAEHSKYLGKVAEKILSTQEKYPVAAGELLEDIVVLGKLSAYGITLKYLLRMSGIDIANQDSYANLGIFINTSKNGNNKD